MTMMPRDSMTSSTELAKQGTTGLPQ